MTPAHLPPWYDAEARLLPPPKLTLLAFTSRD